MIEALILFLVSVLVICLVAWVIVYALAMLPIPEPIARMVPAIVWVIAALAILIRALPVLGISI